MSEARSEFHGIPGIDGIEFRYDETGDLDEVLVYVQGERIVHVERMDGTYFWMGMYTDKIEGSVNFGSVSGRAAVQMFNAEGYPKYDDSKLPSLMELKGLLRESPGPSPEELREK